MSLIGPSTGWLLGKQMYSIGAQQELLKSAGANCFEGTVGTWDANKPQIRMLNKGSEFDKSFSYRSIHLGDIGEEDIEIKCVFAQKIVRAYHAGTAVSHILKANGEYPLLACEKMMEAGIPLAMENMDIRKTSGFLIAELRYVQSVLNCPFVLDVQHAYEHDTSMAYAKDLFEVFQDELAHLHVSGQTTTNIHALVCKAENAKEIVKFLGYIFEKKQPPMILEGEYSTAEELSQEIQFLKKELGL